MRKLIFESNLSLEQIRARLEALTEPADSFGWRISYKAAFHSHFYDQKHFFLIKTRAGKSGGGSINQLVFLGSMDEKAGKTQIRGRFGWERKRLILYAALLIPFLLLSESPAMAIISCLLYFVLLAMFTVFSSSFYSREAEEVSSFIEKHLLS